jgi:hypothetical protein
MEHSNQTEWTVIGLVLLIAAWMIVIPLAQ